MKTNNTDMKFKHTPGPWTAGLGQRDASDVVGKEKL